MSEEKELEYSDNPDFNQSVDDEIGEINIYGEKFLPSNVLFELKRETYRIALTEFSESQFEELQELIFDSFAALIAYNYRLSVRGPGANDPVKKFLHLKDAWEGAINILNALAFWEVRAKSINLKTANVYHSGNPNLMNL
jgi:tRNA(His) 5'-end guanylyltransferase